MMRAVIKKSSINYPGYHLPAFDNKGPNEEADGSRSGQFTKRIFGFIKIEFFTE